MQWIRQRICITHSITTDKFDEFFTDSLARARSADMARTSLMDYLSEKHGSGAAVFFSCEKFEEDYEGEKICRLNFPFSMNDVLSCTVF